MGAILVLHWENAKYAAKMDRKKIQILVAEIRIPVVEVQTQTAQAVVLLQAHPHRVAQVLAHHQVHRLARHRAAAHQALPLAQVRVLPRVARVHRLARLVHRVRAPAQVPALQAVALPLAQVHRVRAPVLPRAVQVPARVPVAALHQARLAVQVVVVVNVLPE